MSGESRNLKIIPGIPAPERASHRTQQRRHINQNLILSGRWLTNAIVIGLAEALALLTALLLALGLRYLIKGVFVFPDWTMFLMVMWWTGAVGTKLLPGWGLGPVEELRRTILLLSGVYAAVAIAILMSLLTLEFSRIVLIFGFLFSLPLVPLSRIWAKRLLIRGRLWGMQAVLYTNVESAKKLIDALLNQPGMGYMPIAVCDPTQSGSGTTTAAKQTFRDIPILQKVDPEMFADVAIVAMPGESHRSMLDLLENEAGRYRHTVIIPDMDDFHSLWVQARDLGGVLGLEISHNLHDPWSKGFKRLTDYAFVLVLAPIWIPLMAALAGLIWLTDRKPPFFVQTRIGMNNRSFRMWKFRTMRTNAEEVLAEELDKNEALRIEWETHFKLKDDPRITPIGRLLRFTSLDELPQFFNIINGTMSLVGPRPLPDYHDDELPAHIRRMRRTVRPGMTGLWQVSGRSDAGTEGLVKWDAYYIRNWSIWLDVVVLIRTFRVVLSGRGAY